MDTHKSIKEELSQTFPPPSWDEWLSAVTDTLKGADYNKAMKTKTYEGITLEPIYRMEDIASLAFTQSDPGAAPYIRGNDPQTRIERGWMIAQAQDEEDLNTLNSILLDELSRGLSAVNLKLRKADSTCGIELSSLQDLQTVLKGIDLAAAPLFLQLDLEQMPLLKMLEDYLLQNSADLSKLELFTGFDPTGELARKGSLPMQLDEAWQIVGEAVNWALQKAPHCHVLSIDASIYEASGASSTQELAFALSTAIGYIKGLQMLGHEIDAIAPLFSVKLSLGSNLYMEIAKIRAFRLLWAEMIASFGGNADSRKIHIHSITAKFNKSRYDIYNNILRTSTETFAGVIGGVDSLEIDCFDDLVKGSTEFSRRIARNQQILMGEEAYLSRVLDPSGGSYYIEKLSSDLASSAWSLMQEIEAEGGMIKSLIAGKIHPRLEETAKLRIQAVNRRKDIFVGVNAFTAPDEVAAPQRITRKSPEKQLYTLLAGALPVERAVKDIEALRDKVVNAKASKNLTIKLLNMGSLADYKARADFSTAFFQAGSFNVDSLDAFETVEAAIAAAQESDAAAFCICSTDDKYKELVAPLTAGLEGKVMILAGYPTEMLENYKASGIKLFIHLRADLYQSLDELSTMMGVN